MNFQLTVSQKLNYIIAQKILDYIVEHMVLRSVPLCRDKGLEYKFTYGAYHTEFMKRVKLCVRWQEVHMNGQRSLIFFSFFLIN